MFFLNLSAGEFFGLLVSLSGIITALYLLDRSKKKKVVSTLRFWTAAVTAEVRQNRKRMQEPWSLVLQLLSLVLLLLAIAQAEWGSRERSGRDHVLLLDTSAWTAETAGSETLLSKEKAIARRYIAALPAKDRLMLVRADGLATRVTSFTSDRARVLEEVDASTSGFTALNIDQALTFARQAENWASGQRGEIVYIGPRLVARTASIVPKIQDLRLIDVEANREHCGIRRIGAKRSERDPSVWQVAVTVKNYGQERRVVRLRTKYAGTAFAKRALALAPGQQADAEYSFSTNTQDRFLAELESTDSLQTDSKAWLQLPNTNRTAVAVLTDRPAALEPLFEANHRLAVKFFAGSGYPSGPIADVIVYDQVSPKQRPAVPSLFIFPPRDRAPLPVEKAVTDANVNRWDTETALGTGLHAKETRVASAEVFQTFEGDVPVASTTEGPIVVARTAAGSRPKFAVIGFDPVADDLKFQVAVPLLFANLMHWLAPDAFRITHLETEQLGAANVELDPSEGIDRIRVTDETGAALPFTVRDRILQLFVSRPSVVHIVSSNRERVLSLTLPEIAELEWKAPEGALSGLSRGGSLSAHAINLWRWFAALGLAGLFLEWMLFGQQRSKQRKNAGIARAGRAGSQTERELVAK